MLLLLALLANERKREREIEKKFYLTFEPVFHSSSLERFEGYKLLYTPYNAGTDNQELSSPDNASSTEVICLAPAVGSIIKKSFVNLPTLPKFLSNSTFLNPN